jgi:hypothetical protein
VLHALESITSITYCSMQLRGKLTDGVGVHFLRYSEGKNKVDGYRVMQVGPDFIVFAGDVGVLKCRIEKDAESAIAVAMDLLENPDEWWSVLRQRLAANDVARQSSGMSVDIAAVDRPTATLRVLA